MDSGDGMGWLSSRLAARKPIATTAAIAVLAGVPIGIAVLHQGFPVTDPDLHVRDVWVTNAEELAAGRLNRQIEELDASVATSSSETDVVQHGDDVFLYDAAAGAIERVDPAFTTLVQRIDVPPASTIAYGGDVLAVLSPRGELWAVPAGGELSFDWRGTDPVAELGADGDVAVSAEGTVFATDAGDGLLLTLERGADETTQREVGELGAHEIAAVGERAVIFDRDENAIIVDERRTELPETGLRLQQSGPEHDDVLVATAGALLEVPLGGGDVREIPHEGAAPATDAEGVAAPVRVGACAHGAWADAGRYLAACDDTEPRGIDLEQSTAGARLEFRVNRDVVVLNNLANGDSWLVDSDLRLVDNWEEVTPPEETDELEGEEKSSQQTFEDTLAERTEVNRPPVARDDDYGVRPGRTTVIEVLENDTDPDGDVLTIAATNGVPEGAGTLDLIDGGRALQFTPAEGAAGTTSFRYTADDGRGGVAEASVNLRIVPDSENAPPVAMRNGAVSVEQGQHISYNLLADWNDPDGDDLFLVDASPTGGDVVRSSPDGYVTFEHKSAELGLKEVAYTVSDGRASASGTFTVDVKPTGSLNPVGTPDYAQTFVGEAVVVEPLINDLSPSGAPLQLLGVQDPPDGASVVVNPERGTITVTSTTPGELVFLYDVGAGTNVSVGLVRVQVVEPPADAPPPIAVTDTAYLRPGEPTSVSVLANDVSPSGRVLAVQSIDDTGTEGLVSVELITNTVARVSASEAIDRQLQFEYVVSDGINTATATVTVVPVPPLVKHQPPVAIDDSAIVRAGDIVSVPVLDNDYHPDAASFHLLPELDQSGASDGLAFVDGDRLRFQAPDSPGVRTIVYTIGDETEQIARATLTVTVVGRDSENRPPVPTPQTSRTFAGSAVKIDVPLDGIDPDGDSVVVRQMGVAPSLGRIIERTSTSFTYEAFDGASGTDTFTYEVEDALGATATGTIRIGVIPRPPVQLPPNAVDDVIEMKPGRTVGAEVLLNDTDPSGYSLHVADLPEVDEGIEAEIRDRRRVVVTAPEQEGAYVVRYEISNGHGGVDTAFLQIAVSEDAVIDPPTAEDQVIEPSQVVAGESVTVDPLRDATNPGGLVEDLVVSLEGPNAGRADLAADGTITVEPGSDRYAVAFRLTNELDDLSAMAFVIVPPVPTGEDEQPTEEQRPKTQEELDAEERAKFPAPHLKSLPEIIVPMNGSEEWSVDELVEVPSGQPATVLSATASNARSDPFVGPTQLQFQPETDYRGPATLTFEVTDGSGADDPVGRTAILTLPITVGDPGFNDVPPAFTPRAETIEAGEAALEVDLRSSTDQPNPDNIEKVSYGNLEGATDEIEASIVDGDTLRVSAPLGVQPGTSTRLSFDLTFNEFTVPGYIDVKVVSSTRPKARAVDDPSTGEIEIRRGGNSRTIDVLANDFNPFAQDDVPLTVIGAEIAQDSVGSNASVSHTPEDITVRTGSAFTGTLSIIYRIADGTKDPAREVQGRVTVIVRDVPDAPGAPSAQAGDGRATISWNAPAHNNSPIDQYVVTWSGGQQTFGADAAGKSQTIGGLRNGTAYQFSVQARNAVGEGAVSNPSAAVTPWGTPTAPQNLRLSKGGDAPTTVRADWNAPSDEGGGNISYRVRINGGGWETVGGTSKSWGGIGSGNHTVEVYAVNGGNNSGPPASQRIVVNDPPPPQPSGSIGKGPSRSCQSGGGGCAEVRITWQNMDPGQYRVFATINGGSCCSYQQTVQVGSSGQLQLLNHLGIRAGGETIAVRFEAINGGTSRTLGAISGTQWNNLGYNTW
ncbi:Ig-like domain-containing protein [Agromyces aerolatus]|uniref:Ig-like domain-containing protein n=1 Tax=Agromyces sp. LY-1074 TaxID=3074080 RepID=UPI0028666524|nr:MULTISPECIES: Ig-like domain-containing protein [unclassified Agromyces]MDR5700006.1 Ig-like domain-containing protein [Agromyces sp. LY-1074]MDR5706182.1 Ig-like domain-containing protein [Agromyces sp. LY-1358]